MNKEKYIPRIKGHAVVLGGSGGIGREVVLALVANGANAVSYTYGKNKKEAEKLSKILKAKRVKHHFSPLDIADEKAIRYFLERAVKMVEEEISYAVNTVAYSPNTDFLKQTVGEWEKVLNINVIGNMLAARAIGERMKAKKVRGSVVLTSSDNAELSWDPKSAHYDASKSAVSCNVRHFAEQYKRQGIRFNVVEPGWTDTAMNKTLSQNERQKAIRRTLMGRFAKPEEIARAFITTLTNPFFNANIVRINGGFK